MSRVRGALSQVDYRIAKKVMAKFKAYHDLELRYRIHHLERVRQENPESVETHELHMDLMDAFKQINSYCGNIGRAIRSISESHKVEAEGIEGIDETG